MQCAKIALTAAEFLILFSCLRSDVLWMKGVSLEVLVRRFKSLRKNLCGLQLKKLRTERHQSIEEVAAALDVDYGIPLDRTNLGRIESGERAVYDMELLAFAHLFNVSIEYLLLGDDFETVEISEVLKKVQVPNATRRGSTDQAS